MNSHSLDHTTKKLGHIRVAGPDKKGIIATVTTHLFKNNLNIEDIDQRILEGFLVMNMVVDLKEAPSIPQLREGLKEVGQKIGMEITLQLEESRKIRHVALLVTKEPHCLNTLLKEMDSGKIKGRPVLILGNRPDLEPIAKKHKIPFFYSASTNRREHENFILEKLSEADIDLIVLARYMQILSPEFCFRYEGKMINIHPSLLPSFPGARAYSQAYHKGVEVVGVTSHFVTTDLDQGPIICQDAFKVDKNRDTLERIIEKGKKLEAKVLAQAVKLYCENRLALRRGKVIDSRQMHEFEKQVREFYK
ncbi:MAG: formyltetrahydrofolate deformylase [Deltaproteobacteria bacterium]|nr:formyltetrahydrofolate deformylase [Deltaproteobacteria bacterium]